MSNLIFFVFLSTNEKFTDELENGVIHVLIFTALHVMQTRYSEENSVRLSVCQTRGL